MKIIKLEAENIQKIKAIEITPEGNTVVISGKNSQGKTSVLDSIAYVLGGKSMIPQKPIRKGQKEASVKVDLDKYVVERHWTADDKSYLKVSSKDGAYFQSPQKLLDSLIGDLSFDPLVFSRADRRSQVETLLQVADFKVDEGVLKSLSGISEFTSELSIDKIGEAYDKVYIERGTVNRDIKNLKGQQVGIEIPAGMENINRVSVKELFEERKKLEKQKEDNSNVKISHAKFITELDKLKADINIVEDQLSALKIQLKDTEKELSDMKTQLEGDEKIVKTFEKDTGVLTLKDPNFSEIDKKISKADEINKIAQSIEALKDIKKKITRETKKADGLTENLEKIMDYKDKIIGNSKMPIKGLSFEEDTITFNGIPFDQTSDSEKLKVSLAIAMALNPKIRVIRITDGSLLDSDNMKVITEMAKAKDFQVWIEKVDDTGKVGIYIEDGMVKNEKGGEK